MPRRPGPSIDRQQVVQAAVACVRAEGPEALGINRVARALGIKPPSLYNHVRDGEDLAMAVSIEGNRMLMSALADAAAAQAAPKAALSAICHAARRWALENPALYAVMSRHAPDPALPEFAPMLEQSFAVFERPLRALGLPAADTTHAIRALRAAVHGFVLLETTGQLRLAERVDLSFEWLIDALLRGV